MNNETIGIIFMTVCLFFGYQINTFNIGNRPYSMHYKSHGLVEKKGLMNLIYYKPQHFHRYHITEVISFFVSFFCLLLGIVFSIISEINNSLSSILIFILTILMFIWIIGSFVKVVYIDITYKKEEKYRISETTLQVDDKLMNELFKYAGSLRFNLDHSYELRLNKIDPNDKEKIDELDKEYIQYYKDYKKIYVKKNKVIYVEEINDGLVSPSRKIVVNKISNSKFPRSYDLTTDNIINHIPSNEIKKYLFQNKDKLSIMQYATLVENYYKGNMVAIFEALKDFSDNEFEKELFTIAMKDYRKYKRIEKRTMDFYEQNDPREKKPMCPFEEFIYLPTLFKEYDLALLLGEQPKIVMIGKNIKFDENDTEDNKNYDFSDLSYMAYDLDTTFEISEENLVNIHVHAHYCELEKIGNSNLTSKQLENYLKLTKVLKESLKEL